MQMTDGGHSVWCVAAIWWNFSDACCVSPATKPPYVTVTQAVTCYKCKKVNSLCFPFIPFFALIPFSQYRGTH
uniref:Putative secreted peptide n=1 Tax=Anopheles braziliensis TaxID=58242 RepID=A0A2M3ZX71_9DIPT